MNTKTAATNPLLAAQSATRSNQATSNAFSANKNSATQQPSFSSALQSANNARASEQNSRPATPQPAASAQRPANQAPTTNQTTTAAQQNQVKTPQAGPSQNSTPSSTSTQQTSTQNSAQSSQQTTAETATPTAADLAAQAAAALQALQSMLMQQPAQNSNLAAASGVAGDAAAMMQSAGLGALTQSTSRLPVGLATSTTDSAATTANLAGFSSSDSALPDSITTSLTLSTSFAPRTGATTTSVTLTSTTDPQGQAQSGQQQSKTLAELTASLQAGSGTGNLKTETSSREGAGAGNAFTADLNNAQALYATRTEAKLESQTSTAVTQHTVATPVSSYHWAEELGNRVHWVATRDNGRADLVLTPPQMGKIEVSINLTGDQASASFTAANQATREALQDAMPRLREILAESGIQLGQTSVNAGNSGQSQNPSQNMNTHNAHARSNWQDDTIDTTQSAAPVSSRSVSLNNGLVDLFA